MNEKKRADLKRVLIDASNTRKHMFEKMKEIVSEIKDPNERVDKNTIDKN